MNGITAKYWKTLISLFLLFVITIYIFFVSILSQEVHTLKAIPPATAYELPEKQLLSANEHIAQLLFLDNLAQSDEHKLVVKIAKKNDKK